VFSCDYVANPGSPFPAAAHQVALANLNTYFPTLYWLHLQHAFDTQLSEAVEPGSIREVGGIC
jgi:hypothetical protein